MGIIAGGIGGDGPGFEMPRMPDIGSWFGGGGEGTGATIGRTAGSALGGLFGMGGIGGSVGATVGGAAETGIGAISDWASGFDFGSIGTGSPWLMSDERLKQNILPISGALDRI